MNQGDALTKLSADDDFIVVLLEHDYDFSATTPGSTNTVAAGMYFVEQTGTSKDPFLEYTSGGYVNDPFGIDMDDINSKVIGVASGNIDEVMGI